MEISPISILFTRDHLDRVQFDVLGNIADVLRRSHAAVPDLSVAGLWGAISAVASRVAYRGPSPEALGLAVSAARRLAWILARVDGSRALIVELAEGRCPPIVVRTYDRTLTVDDRVELEALRRGLDVVSVGPGKSAYRD